MSPVVTTQYSWTLLGPGGRYGVLQYQVEATLADPKRVETVLFFGGFSFQIPLTIFEITALFAAVLMLAIALVLFYVRRRSKRFT